MSEQPMPESPQPEQAPPAPETSEAPPSPPSPSRDEWWGEKGEKDANEKEEEKTHEKEEKPKDIAEKWRQDPLSAIVAAACLIVGGFVLILDNLRVPVFRGNGWSIALVCAGLILGLAAVVRVTVPEYRRPIRGTVVLAAVLFGLGLSGWVGTGVMWAVAIMGLGAFILIRGLSSRR